jgi:hypothetical protein
MFVENYPKVERGWKIFDLGEEFKANLIKFQRFSWPHTILWEAFG